MSVPSQAACRPRRSLAVDFLESHPGAAAVSLLAAALGGAAAWIDGAAAGPQLFAAMTPDELTAWAKAITGAAFMAVNTLVGCYNLVQLARGKKRQPRRPKTAGPADPSPAK